MAGFEAPRRDAESSNKIPLVWKERSERMGKLTREAKRTINKAAKSKGSGGGTKGKKSSGNGSDKAKRVAREILM